MDSIGSQQFNVPEAFCVMNVNQTTKQRKIAFVVLTPIYSI